MKFSILLTLLLSLNASANWYYGLNTRQTNDDSKPRMRAAAPVSMDKETFYGKTITPSGFNMVYPKSYIRIMKYCYGLSTDENKMMDRALRENNQKTIKRLDCYTLGLGRDLLNYEKNGQNAREISYENRNWRALNYINSLR